MGSAFVFVSPISPIGSLFPYVTEGEVGIVIGCTILTSYFLKESRGKTDEQEMKKRFRKEL